VVKIKLLYRRLL